MLKAETLVRDSFNTEFNAHATVPKDRSPVAKRATEKGIEQLACKTDISESEGDDVIVTWITQSWISINSITDEKVSKK